MKKVICLVLSVLLICAMPLGLAGCGGNTGGTQGEPHDPGCWIIPPPDDGAMTDLMQGIAAKTPIGVSDLAMDSARLTDFGLRLFQAGKKDGENTLISPLSVLCALAMTTNGAKEETRAQMETVLGMKAEDLNEYLYSYMKGLPRSETCKLDLANSIWFTDDDSFAVNRDFLQTNADYYGADLYQAPFNDATCRAINDWVKEKTDGMIPQILDHIPADAVMYLVNALAFDAQWASPYNENQVRENLFTREDGTKETVELLFDREHVYLETENAAGFLKYYDGDEYAFAALLPNEGVTVAELVDSLTGAELHELLTHPEDVPVETAIPKFESDYSAELSDVLRDMGMPLAFDGDRADFTDLGIADWNIYISRVLHKTFISVGEKGTRAGAATVVEMAKNTSFMPPEEVKTVFLDRPFVYMLVDCRTGTPFFIGTMMNPGE